jgi:autotransporter-associated beta strand protein
LGKSLGSLTLLALAGSAMAQTYTYNPTTTTDNWSTGINWDATPVSGIDTSLVFVPTLGTFPGAVTNTSNNNLGTFQLNQLTLGGIGPVADSNPVVVNITGGTLDFNLSSGFATPVVNLNATNGTGASTVTYNVSSALALTTDTLFTGNGNAAFNFSGVISGGALTKSGTSTLTLSGANTYTGITTVNNGTLALGASNVIGTGDVSVNGVTAVLSMGGNSDTVGTVTVDGGGSITGTGTLTSTTSFEMYNGSALVVLAGDVVFNK